jgi:Secretion system C-terminal sorting domain
MKKFLLNSKLLVITFVIANLFLLNTNAGFAATRTWLPTIGGLWTTAANWSSGVVPATGDDVIINTNQTGNITAVPVISLLSLTISGNCDFEGAASGNTVTVTGTFTVAASITLTLGSGGGSRVNFTLANTGTGIINGTVDIVSGGTNRTFTNNGDLTISGAGVINDAGSGGGNSSDFILGASATLRIGSAVGITTSPTLTGNIQVTGLRTFPTTANYIYNGTAIQVTGNGLPATVNNLTVNNTAGVTLTNVVTVSSVLTLTNGILTIPAAATPNLILSGGTVIGGAPFSVTKHIRSAVSGANTGLIRVNNIPVSTAYLFPVGNGTSYLPVTLNSANTVANNSFSVSAFNGITANGLPNGTAFTALQKDKCVDAVWTINYNGTGTPVAPLAVSMTLAWPAALEGTAFSANPNPLIGIAHYNGPAWGTCVGSGNNVANTATNTNVTTFSPFAVGTINAGGAPLAIKVNYFNAAKGNGVNTLNWSAACSSTEATFEIERSSDGVNFTAIHSITATQARCAQPFSYDDNSNVSALAYYRIKAIDYNGKISYTLIIKVGSQVKDMRLAGLLPNPVSNTAQLSITTAKKDKVQLAIVSLEGKVVYQNSVQLQSGTSIVNLEIGNLSKGTYVVRGVFSDGQTNSIKFVKQ